MVAHPLTNDGSRGRLESTQLRRQLPQWPGDRDVN